ncbi:MAG: RRQRL motif-containing zinc-binding protein [Micromonosporaceae bacterium]
MAALYPLYTDAEGRICYDPDGRHYGVPVYLWRGAPDGVATRRQLAAMQLRPGGQDPVAMVLRPRRRRPAEPLVAYLYRVDLARPKRQVTAAMRAAVQTAVAARRVCGTCERRLTYIPPKSTGYRCWDCHEAGKAVA